MANRNGTGDPRGFNKARSSEFRECSRVRQTPEEGWKTYRPKRWGNNNNNKDEENSLKKLKIIYEFSPCEFFPAGLCSDFSP